MRSARIAVCLRHDRHRCTSPCVVDSSIYNPIHLHKGSDLKSKVLTSWPRMLKTCTCQHKSPYLPYCSIKSLLIRSVAIFSYGVTSQLTGLHGWKHMEKKKEKMATNLIKNIVNEQYGRYGYLWKPVPNCNVLGHGVIILYLKFERLRRCTCWNEETTHDWRSSMTVRITRRSCFRLVWHSIRINSL